MVVLGDVIGIVVSDEVVADRAGKKEQGAQKKHEADGRNAAAI